MTGGREDELRGLAEEAAWRRALSPQPGDTADEPSLELAAVLPSTRRKRRWAPWVAVPLAAAAVLVFVFDGETSRTKSVHDRGCHAVVREVVAEGGALRGELVIDGPCYGTLLAVEPDAKVVREVYRTEEARSGAVEIDEAWGFSGRRLLVWIATVQRTPADPEVIRALLVRIGEGRGCTIGDEPCAVDVVEID